MTPSLHSTDLTVAETALTRLASALVQADDVLPQACTVADLMPQLTPHDQVILTQIVRRITALEEQHGPEAAQKALEDVLDLLSEQRGKPC